MHGFPKYLRMYSAVYDYVAVCARVSLRISNQYNRCCGNLETILLTIIYYSQNLIKTLFWLQLCKEFLAGF
jgi:hypothetical protein